MKNIIRKITTLDTTEKILNSGYICILIGMSLPWLKDIQLEVNNTYSAFSFYTGAIGTIIFLLTIFLLLITIVPLFYNQTLIPKKHTNYLRFHLSALISILLLTILIVLTSVTWEFTKYNIELGIYISILGSIISSIYTFLLWHSHQTENTVNAQQVHANSTESVLSVQGKPIIIPEPPRPESHKLFR